MSTARVFAVILIAAGTLGLVYRGFSYTKNEHQAKIGSLELSIKNKQNVDIPTWAGAGAIVAGAALLLFGGPRR